jgi:hypothetical protein
MTDAQMTVELRGRQQQYAQPGLPTPELQEDEHTAARRISKRLHVTTL